MTEQHHGRYFAQEVTLDHSESIRKQIQDDLDAVEPQEWHLVRYIWPRRIRKRRGSEGG